MSEQQVDLLLAAGRVVSCASPGGQRRGAAMADAGVIDGGAVAVSGGRIVAVGPHAELTARYRAQERVDCGTRVLVPGLVDPHTHCLYAGDRIADFEARLRGASYSELLAAGGGILKTVSDTNGAPWEALLGQTRRRLDRMLVHGTTTVEVKTGYGLDTAAELRMLEAIAALDATHPLDLVPTFLGAHAVPPAYRGRTDAYVDLVCNQMLPAALSLWRTLRPGGTLFCDVFCEPGAFDVRQSRRVLETAAGLGYRLKLHADEFEAIGGTGLAIELGATSVDHLVATQTHEARELAASEVVAVALPGTPLGLGHSRHMPARTIVDAGGALALASDCNPGTSVCESLPLLGALGSRMLRLLPHEAIVAMTINAAHAVGRGDRVGSLEPGKDADLVLLDADDERELVYRFGANPVLRVWKRGKLVVDNDPQMFHQ